MSLAAKLKAEALGQRQEQVTPTETTNEASASAGNSGSDQVSENQAGEEVTSDMELSPEDAQRRSIESYEDEVKKLREENAKRRKREQEAREKALAQADEIFKSEREMYESKLAELQAQLEKTKSSKSESASEEIDNQIKAKEKDAQYDQIMKKLQELEKANEEKDRILREAKEREEEEKQLRRQAAESRFNSLLKEIPEDQQEFAKVMFNGAGDPQKGLLTVTEAKAKGLFGKKRVEVIHSPAKSTSTATSETNTNKNLSSKEKMRLALKAQRGANGKHGINQRLTK